MIKNLIKLLLDNQAKPPAVRCEQAADGADVYLSGVIAADWGISAAMLRSALETAGGADVRLHINSPGGDVFEARQMQAAIVGYSGAVTAIVEGVAASAATIVSMSANSVQMLKGSRFMIHKGWSIGIGNDTDMYALGDLLKSFDAELAAEYATKTGGAADQMAAWMAAETWFTAEQAAEAGFVDQVIDNVKNLSSAGAWNLSAYANAPADEPPPAPDYAAIRAANERRMRMLQIA